MNGVEAIVLTVALYAMHLRRIGNDAAGAIAQYRIVPPTAFPELVDELDIFLGDMVTIVMVLPVIPTRGGKAAS